MFVDWTTCFYWRKWSWESDMSSNFEKVTLSNLGVGVLVIHYINGVSRPLPRDEPIALWRCKVNHCSIWVSNVLISSDVILCIITSMFIISIGTGPSDGDGSSGDERQANDAFLRELDSSACCVCDRWFFTVEVLPGMDNGCIGATRLWAVCLRVGNVLRVKDILVIFYLFWTN